jgi:GntR family transcriptional regulator
LTEFVPKYKKIARDLQARIADKTYPVGSQLPTEHELMARLNVSRSTVNSALDHLQSIGLVYRRPRSGTRVISRFPMRSEIEGVVLNDWAQYGVGYEFRVDDIRLEPLPDIANNTEARFEDPWLLLKGARIDIKTREMLCTVDLYVNPKFSAIRDRITEYPPRIYTIIEEQFGPQVAIIDQELRAAMLDESKARALGALPNTPCIQVMRWFTDAHRGLVEFTIDTHPGDRFKYRTRTYRN